MEHTDRFKDDNESTKLLVLRDDLKRTLIYYQIMRMTLECLRTSDTVKEWAQAAKANKNKNFVDFRAVAADAQRALDAMVLKMKGTMKPDTWNAIMTTLSSEQVQEIDSLLNEITELNEHAIEAITNNVKQAKVNAGIPLNNPGEDTSEMEEMDKIIWSCIEPADKRLEPQISDGYDEGDVYAALKCLYKKLQPNEIS